MRFLEKIFYTFLFLAGINTTWAQNRQLGTWRVYLPYNNVYAIYDGGDKAYCVTPYSLFTYEKTTGVVQTYDKSTGLSDVNVQASNYDASSKYLALAYSDNNLDFIYNGTDVYNLPDIQQYSSAQAITIYSIAFYNGNAYLSSTLGISIINLTRMEISETFTIGSNGRQANVYATTIDGVNMYAATDSGIKYAPLSSPNIQDFNSWQFLTGTRSLPAKKATLLQAYNGKIYTTISYGSANSTGGISDTLYQYNGTTWTPMAYDTAAETDTITSINISGGNMYITAYGQSGPAHGVEVEIDTTGALTSHYTVNHSKPSGWFNSGNIVWEGDAYNGLFINNQGNVQNIQPDGPQSNKVLSLNVKNGVANVSPGGVNEIWGISYNFDGFFIYNNNTWNNQNQYSNSIFNTYINIVTSGTVASRNKTYFGSYYSGVIEYDNSSRNISTYDNTNSPLEFNLNDPGRIEIGAMGVDQYDNLWMGNSGANYPLKVLQPSGAWQEIQFGISGIQALKRIHVDENNQVWAPSRGGGAGDGGGLLVCGFNQSNDSIVYNSASPARMLTTGAGAGNLPNGNVWCVAEDKTGNIWAGTDAGIGIFYCPGSVLNTTEYCDAQQIKVTLNGVVGYLFGMESVRALAVDAANRIWVGTTNGVWLISDDGQTTYLNFNIDNSPMPANQVTDIGIDNTTGEVFIGTIAGLVSYQGDAVDTCVGCGKEALVYPNPVTPDYSGPIAIKGLVDNAYVKITDATGTLVFQGRANGTQMIWDGKGYDGVRAKSGVYLVFSSTDSGKSRKVAKILMAN